VTTNDFEQLQTVEELINETIRRNLNQDGTIQTAVLQDLIINAACAVGKLDALIASAGPPRKLRQYWISHSINAGFEHSGFDVTSLECGIRKSSTPKSGRHSNNQKPHQVGQ